MSLPASAFDEAAGALESADRVALVCHVNPDADAMGSMLGLACFLAERGKTVAATWPNDPADPPRWLEVFPGRDHLVAPGKMPKEPPVLVTLDAADRKRLGGLSYLVDRAPTVICIDHHRTNPGFGTLNMVDGDASATAEIVFHLIERMDGDLSADSAACLYAGLVTDTGRFQYESTGPDVLRVAARLREHPFDHVRLTQALYEDNSLASLKLTGKLLDRAALVPEAGLVWTHLTRGDLEAAGVPIQETDDLIDAVRTTREADVAAVIKEQREEGLKVSLRSRGGTDVSAIAEGFGGGGHRLAAGYTSPTGLEETVSKLVDVLVATRAETHGP